MSLQLDKLKKKFTKNNNAICRILYYIIFYNTYMINQVLKWFGYFFVFKNLCP